MNSTRFSIPCLAGSPFPTVTCPYMGFYSASTCPPGSNGISAQTGAYKTSCVCPGQVADSNLLMGSYFCFNVISTGSNIQFTASQALLDAADNRDLVLMQTDEKAGSVPGQYTRTFAVKAVSFVDSTNLGVCFTANGTALRCVSFFFMLPPDSVSVAPMDHGDGLAPENHTLLAYPYQTLRFTIQANN